jgi:hypothetical protein
VASAIAATLKESAAAAAIANAAARFSGLLVLREGRIAVGWPRREKLFTKSFPFLTDFEWSLRLDPPPMASRRCDRPVTDK